MSSFDDIFHQAQTELLFPNTSFSALILFKLPVLPPLFCIQQNSIAVLRSGQGPVPDFLQAAETTQTDVMIIKAAISDTGRIYIVRHICLPQSQSELRNFS